LQSLVEQQAKQWMDYMEESLQIDEKVFLEDDYRLDKEVDTTSSLCGSRIQSKLDVLSSSNHSQQHLRQYNNDSTVGLEHYDGKHISDEASFKAQIKQKIGFMFSGVTDYRGVCILEAKDVDHLELEDVLHLLKFAFIRCNESIYKDLVMSKNEDSFDVQRLKIQCERLVHQLTDKERVYKESELILHRQIQSLKDMLDIKDRVIHAIQSSRVAAAHHFHPSRSREVSQPMDPLAQLEEMDAILTKCLGQKRRTGLNVVDAFKLYLQLLRKKMHSSSLSSSCGGDLPISSFNMFSPIPNVRNKDLSYQEITSSLLLTSTPVIP
jgi:hypothetical protein